MEYEEQIDLVKLTKYLLKKCYWIILAAVVFGIGAFGVSKFMIQPKYDAHTRIYVLNQTSNDSIAYSDMQISRQLAKDYEVLITSESVTNKVVEMLGLNMTGRALATKITVSVVNDTRILQITVRDTDPDKAADIANCVRMVAAEQIVEVMGVNAVNLVYDAIPPKSPTTPNVQRNTLLGVAGGAILVVALLVFLFILDDSIKTEEDVMSYLQLSTIGLIPEVKSYNKGKRRRK